MVHHRNMKVGASGGWVLALVIFAVWLVPGTALAEDPVGRMLVASGGVTAKQEGVSARGLGRRDPVYAGDTIRTGPRGRAQIRFKDGGLVDLKPSTRFAIESYTGEADEGNVVLNFVRGAMRTITGAIGAERGENYRMETPTATIGVRGTAYALHYCDEACAAEGGQQGIYGRVDDGRIVARNEQGEAVFSSGSFFSVEQGGAPKRIVAPPPGVLDGSGEAASEETSPEEASEGAGEGASSRAVDTSEAERVTVRPGETTEQGEVAESEFEAADEVEQIDEREPDDGGSGDGGNGGDGGTGGGGDGSDVIGEFPTNGGTVVFAGALTGGNDNNAFVLPTMSDSTNPFVGEVVPDDFATLDGAEPTIDEAGATTVADAAGEFQVQWVRWSIPVDPDQDGNSDGTGRLAFAFTDFANITSEGALATGSANYGLASGPLALGRAGGLWGFEAIGIDANFTEGVASLQNFSLFEQNGNGFISLDSTSTGPIEASTSTVEFSNVALSGDGNFNGDINGVFVGEGGEALVIGFRLDQNNGSNSISGVQIVK